MTRHSISQLPCIVLGLVLGITLAGMATAQGTFSATSAQGSKPKVLLPDGTPAAGSVYEVEILILNPRTGAFEAGYRDGVQTSLTGLYAGVNAGLFGAGTITVPFIQPGQPATIRVRVRDKSSGPTWETAIPHGETTFTVPHLGGVPDPKTDIPSPPSPIIPFYSGITLNFLRQWTEAVSTQVQRLGEKIYLTWPYPQETVGVWRGFYLATDTNALNLAVKPLWGDIWYGFSNGPRQGSAPPIFLHVPDPRGPIAITNGTAYVELNVQDYPSVFVRMLVTYCAGCP